MDAERGERERENPGLSNVDLKKGHHGRRNLYKWIGYFLTLGYNA